MELTIDQRRIASLLADTERVFPGAVDLNQFTPWAGLRPCSPSGIPYIPWLFRINALSWISHVAGQANKRMQPRLIRQCNALLRPRSHVRIRSIGGANRAGLAKPKPFLICTSSGSNTYSFSGIDSLGSFTATHTVQFNGHNLLVDAGYMF